MGHPNPPGRNTTHDWSHTVDAGHLAEIRRQPQAFAPGGVLHLILEVIEAGDEQLDRAAGRTSLGRVSRTARRADPGGG